MKLNYRLVYIALWLSFFAFFLYKLLTSKQIESNCALTKRLLRSLHQYVLRLRRKSTHFWYKLLKTLWVRMSFAPILILDRGLVGSTTHVHLPVAPTASSSPVRSFLRMRRKKNDTSFTKISNLFRNLLIWKKRG